MINIESYIASLILLLEREFCENLLYVGLQGSYLRGDATEYSDIDIMVILDKLSVSDLDTYRSIIQSLGDYDKSCGFICSKSDLANWNPLEICNLLHSTKDYYGCLQDFIPFYTDQDIRNFVKFSINNLYHELCHRYIHATPEKNIAHLPCTYKGVFFILQNLYYLRSRTFISTKLELLSLLQGKDHDVLKCAMDMNNGIQWDFSECFELILSWCQEILQSI